MTPENIFNSILSNDTIYVRKYEDLIKYNLINRNLDDILFLSHWNDGVEGYFRVLLRYELDIYVLEAFDKDEERMYKPAGIVDLINGSEYDTVEIWLDKHWLQKNFTELYDTIPPYKELFT